MKKILVERLGRAISNRAKKAVGNRLTRHSEERKNKLKNVVSR
ncbi:MAG: hypothetical protein WCP85_27590 [Mariniphaga sp.]